ncbi:MAG: sulfurtransferase complex subunit TusB [Alphaproteobacteria bacterium]|jgi:tRNA 2-thiouridine synthesizing protein B|nr:sulfurtransferase complex subunit TusB [Alphaproteobacteria bacterium]|tara:strand:+ start:744 stop:1064 length:321 start_codon:yes stop_codon:yes gene_type:complete
MSENRKVLHTVNKSPFERNSLESCLRLAAKGSSILLIEDGAYAALKDSQGSEALAARAGDFSLYVLGPDMEARGLSGKPLIEGCNVVDYGGFVDLAAEHDMVQSWL